MDTGILSPGWAATGVEQLVGERAVVRAMLDVELALARAQAEFGMIPADAVTAIDKAVNVVNAVEADGDDGLGGIDIAALAVGVRATANPIVALVGGLTAAVAAIDERAAEYVHRGSTSQDILDSALMLLAARVLSRIDTELACCADALAGLVRTHLSTPMAGRTLTQHAVPITFGLKAAGWLELVLDARERIQRTASTLPASLGGAAGTLSAYAEYAGVDGEAVLALAEPFARHLGLRAQHVPWHGIRTPLADLAAALTFTTGALGKIAVDVQVLTRTEIREVIEPAAPGRGASSAMPQKHNPVFATLILTAARQLPAIALILNQSMVAEDERSSGGWHAEWQPLTECLRLAAGAASNAAELLGRLTVLPAAMRRNLELTGGALVSERITTVLAPLVGKATAKKLLTEILAERGDDEDRPDLVELVVGAVRARGAEIEPDTVARVLDPTEYLGASVAIAERVLRRYRC